MIKLTERKIIEMVKSVAKQLLTEMAVSRGEYIQYGINQSDTVLRHIGKICVYEDDVKMNHWVEHWEDEIAAQIYDLGKIDITKDNKECKIKKKAFVKSVIEARLGVNFSEYDDKMCSYITDGLEDEGMTKEQIRKIDVKTIASLNKERVKKYLLSFVDLISIKDLGELKEKCKTAAHNF